MGVAPPPRGGQCQRGVKTMLSHPHELIFPAALATSIPVLAFNLLGDG